MHFGGKPTFQGILHLSFSGFQRPIPEEFLCDDVWGDQLPHRLAIILRLGQPTFTWENGRLWALPLNTVISPNCCEGRIQGNSSWFTQVDCQMDFHYLSFPELSPDLHSVQVPSRVAAPVVVSYPDFLYDIANILQLGKDNTVFAEPLPPSWRMYNPNPHSLTSTINMSSAPLSKYRRLSLLLTHRCFCCVHTAFRPYKAINTSASVPAPNTSLV